MMHFLHPGFFPGNYKRADRMMNRKQTNPDRGRTIKQLEQEKEELRQSNEAYRQLVENLNEVLYTLDLKAVVTFITPNVEKISGYRPEEIVGRRFTDFVHPGDLTAHRFDAFQKILAGENHITEYRYLSKKSETVWVRSNARAIVRNGEVVGIQGMLVDISDQKRFESALRQSERKFRDIFDSSGDAILIHDKEGRVLEANAPALDWMGYTREELVRLTLRDIVHPKRLHLLPGRLKTIDRTGREVFESIVWGKDGREIPVEINSRKIEYEGRTCFLSLARDISRRLEKETEYAQILNTSIDGFWVVDMEGRILEVNPAAARMLGCSQAEMLHLYVDDIDAVETREQIRQRMDRIRKEGSARFETRHRRTDDAVIDVEVSSSYIPHSGGRLLAFLRDITERKQTEAEKARLQEHFHQVQKVESVGRLAGGVAHDLNNLLSPILGYGELLLDQEGPDAAWKTRICRIIDAAERAKALVRQLLAFSRQQMLEFKPFDVNEHLQDFRSLMRHTLREDIEIRMNLADALPLVNGDTSQMEQVLLNLVVNAQDAMPQGGALTIETASVWLDESYARLKKGVTPGRYVMLAVSDTGQGMTSDILENLFEPFYTTKEKEMGTGLGLSTVYGIVKQHGGNIWAYSEPGLGATFKIYLPVSTDSPEPEPSAAEEAPLPDRTGTETVLLVEDEEIVRELVCSMLEMQGYEVLSAENGKHALSLLKTYEGPLDLLLTDVVMPDMNGKELYERISRAYPDLGTIYMSGYSENVIAYHGVLKPGVNFIQKPFSVNDLAARIREVLGR
jgi:PAS domain S-box-containing protein